jgi:glycerophosphoryl diester phosphodiesterase
MRKLILLISFVILGLTSCDNIVEIDHPVVDPSGFLNQTTPLPNYSKSLMNGIYSVVGGSEQFGEQVVLKWNGNNLSIFSSKDVGYFVMQGGSLDSVLFFMGYWRFNVNSETGPVNFYISRDEGGAKLLSNDSTNLKITLRGAYGNGKELPNKVLVLEYLRPFSDFVKQSDFYILAHRGGGRNSEYLGVSENSIEIINLAESYGANGIEIDVHVSTDGVPFLYHDSDINLRLTQKGVIWGKVEDFSWAQLSAFITLKNGEKIPTLRDALEFVLEHTTLNFVWLDLKSETNEIPMVIELQQEILQRAEILNRDLKIVLGLPTEDKFNSLMAYPGFENIPSLCELDVSFVRQVNANVWAPRWTQGLQTGLVQEMHSEGRLAFVWTLDEPAFVESYMRDGDFDGILSNYPSLVAYYHYIR